MLSRSVPCWSTLYSLFGHKECMHGRCSVPTFDWIRSIYTRISSSLNTSPTFCHGNLFKGNASQGFSSGRRSPVSLCHIAGKGNFLGSTSTTRVGYIQDVKRQLLQPCVHFKHLKAFQRKKLKWNVQKKKKENKRKKISQANVPRKQSFSLRISHCSVYGRHCINIGWYPCWYYRDFQWNYLPEASLAVSLEFSKSVDWNALTEEMHLVNNLVCLLRF